MANTRGNADNRNADHRTNDGDMIRQMIYAFENIAQAVRDQASATTEVLRQVQSNNHNHLDNRNTKGNAGYIEWSEFQKTRPLVFKGTYDPTIAEEWLRQLEKIFTILHTGEPQKVAFAVYLLQGEAEHWWRGAKQLLESRNTEITWEVFTTTFLEKYFPESVKEKEIEFLPFKQRGKPYEEYLAKEKEIEFHQFKQRGKPYEEYLAKFEELAKFSTYLRMRQDDAWKAARFEAGLDLNLKAIVAPLEIKSYTELVNKGRIASKTLSDMAQAAQRFSSFKKKPQNNLGVKGKNFKPSQGNTSRSTPSTGNRPRCTKCNRNHYANQPCASVDCYRCGKPGHFARDCRVKLPTGNENRPQATGRVFVLDGNVGKQTEGLIKGSDDQASHDA